MVLYKLLLKKAAMALRHSRLDQQALLQTPIALVLLL